MSDHQAVLRLGAALLLLATMTACWGSQPPSPDTADPRFLAGFWHGLISPVAFLVSLFKEQVRIYAYPNAGLWYDFGFMLGIGGFSGGIFAGSRKSK